MCKLSKKDFSPSTEFIVSEVELLRMKFEGPGSRVEARVSNPSTKLREGIENRKRREVRVIPPPNQDEVKLDACPSYLRNIQTSKVLKDFGSLVLSTDGENLVSLSEAAANHRTPKNKKGRPRQIQDGLFLCFTHTLGCYA
jgi:hypothetical protein